ncbi:hypothetical protein, partial [Micromonospora sp. NPDC005710]|uniref:hypothetical protein n=1 Tax=Micromonospora sp. NPDC005710 TaxID=3157051 RepID=UPI0033EA8F67
AVLGAAGRCRGKTCQCLRHLSTGAACVVVDCESGPVRLHLADRLATQLKATRTPLEALTHPRDLALPVAA